MTLAQAPMDLRHAVLAAFVRSNNSPHQTKLTASDAAFYDSFGFSVAISGPTAVVGAAFKNAGAGSVYGVVHSGTSWIQQAELTPSGGPSSEYFGVSVAISGSTALVGASNNNSGTGAAYVFKRSGTVWTQQAKLVAADGAPNDSFGWSVAVSGVTAVVGTYKNSSTGAAYVFTRSGTSWRQRAKLTAADGTARNYFGYSVAISGPTAVVGAFGNASARGAAYVFVRSGKTWIQQAKLIASDGAAYDYAGWSVAISGSTAVVGAWSANSRAGAAYIFVRSGRTWTQQAKLTASDGVFLDDFGGSVAISESTVVVGAQLKNEQIGAAYMFTRSETTWTQQTELLASDGTGGDEFGYAVAVSGSNAVVGAFAKNSGTGAAYVYRLPSQ
jgi:hypothetical protein